KRYEETGSGTIRNALEHLFAEIGDPDDFIAMVKKYAAGGQSYDGRMSAAVRGVALQHEPVPGRENSFDIHPASVARIRGFLFGLENRRRRSWPRNVCRRSTGRIWHCGK